MTDIETHPSAECLSAYAQGWLDELEMDKIEEHLSSCDSCCRWIREQPEDSLVAKLRRRDGAMRMAESESTIEPPTDFDVPSSFVVPANAKAASHDQTTAGTVAEGPTIPGLPKDLNNHPRYRIVATLGTGGMGTVYQAEHRLMDRPVALKVIRGELLSNPALVERFRGEVKAAARLGSHPNIVAAYDAEQSGETHMLVMEFIEGTDLARLIERQRPLPVGEACEYVRQAALGLQHAFEDGMVHRDIKPQNLMRTDRGQVKVLDFGLARFASEVGSHAGVTAEGMLLGSADYIAPEQIDDPHAADIRADIYSLGCTLYFLLAGRAPFPDGSVIQKLMAHREKTARPLSDFRADVPADLARILERMLAKEPARRFSTPAEVARALAPFADGYGGRIAATRLDDPAISDSSTSRAAGASFASTGGNQKSSGVAPGSGQRPRGPWTRIAIALAVLPIVVCLAVVVYHIQTPIGELVIETEDPNIEVIIKKGGQWVEIVAPKAKKRIELIAGNYELELASDHERFSLSTHSITLKRGDKAIVKVRHDHAPRVARDSMEQPADAKTSRLGQGQPQPAIILTRRTQAILDVLEQIIPMNFADETTLDDVLTYIKQVTFNQEKATDPGLQIYVDPLVEGALKSKVRINVADAPLRVTLSLLLSQVDLAYIVKEDVLIISSTQGIDRERNEKPSPAADATARTKRVLAKLEEPIPMPFDKRVPLDDMLNYIRRATTSPDYDGISIFTDLRSLKEAGCSLSSTVSINLDGVPLKTTLRLLLQQLGLVYIVKDGVLTISSIKGIGKY
jgi:serine/threonine protein kinase